MLSNYVNAASIVHVGRVAYAQLDQKSSLIINADSTGQSQSKDNYVRVKLFLDKESEEMMPTVEYDGITLIKQHIGLDCKSDSPNYVVARGEVRD